VLGGFEGIWHDCKAERRLKREEKWGNLKGIGYTRICTKDRFWLAEGDHEKLSAKNFIFSVLERRTASFVCRSSRVGHFVGEKSREANLVSISDSPISINGTAVLSLHACCLRWRM